MKTVFADTFYFLAYLNRADHNHERAMAAAHAHRGGIVTTAWVLTEVADAFAASALRNRIADFVTSLQADPDTQIIAADRLFERGLKLYNARPDKTWTLTDCISFVVMADERLSDALTGDHHFEQAGFKALLR